MRSTWWFGLFLFVVLTVSAAGSASVPGLVPPGHADGAAAQVDPDGNTTRRGDTVQVDRFAQGPETLERLDENATHAISDVREATGTTTPELVAVLPHHEDDDAAPPREQPQPESNARSEDSHEEAQPEDHEHDEDDEDGLAKQLVSLVPDTPHAPPLTPLLPDTQAFRLDPPTFDPPSNEAPPTARSNERVSPQPLKAADAAPVAAPNMPPGALALALAGVASVTVAAAAASTGPSSSLLAWLRRVFWLPLYARVAKDKVLDHGTRQELLDRLRASPGSCVAELQAASGVSLNTIRHHLRVMQANGVVTSVKQGRRRCFFPVDTGWSAENRVAAAAISARAPRRVFRVIKSRPGIAQQELAAALGVTPTSIAFHARRLQEAGVVRAERTGRVLVYYPVAAVA